MRTQLSLLFVLLASWVWSQTNYPLIPKPNYVEFHDGFFTVKETLIISAPMDMDAEAEPLMKEIRLRKKALYITNKAGIVEDAIVVQIEPKLAPEAYEIQINPKVIFLKAADYTGVQYGFQTLTQLLINVPKDQLQFPCGIIQDAPKFKWRGMHLDVSRHFSPKEAIFKYIDYLAAYKYNTFHWHLTDDQGWRIEIKKYPKLTEVGAWRNGSMVGHYNDQKFDTERYGGYYTEADVRDVVDYARIRHITIVPEIEMPGHARAALAAYPQYSCTGGPFEVAQEWGVLEDVFCPKEETFTFLQDVLTEVMNLFPGQFIHIGGDECPKTRWKACPNCQKRMKENNLKDEHELQSYFIQRIEKFVNAKGKKIIGWDEILEGGLAPNAAVMSWRGTEGGIAAAKQKHQVVMTPGSHCYFDHYQGEPKNEPLAIGGYTPLEKVYSYQPIPTELNADEAQYILGAQANVWTEYIPTFEQVEYMIFPRMTALAEVLWGTANAKDYSNYFNRVTQHFKEWETKKINFSKAVFEITAEVMPNPGGENGVLYVLKSNQNQANIHYTVDGSQPTAQSPTFSNALTVKQSQTVKAAYFEETTQKSALSEQAFTIHKATSCLVNLQNQPDKRYSAGGGFALVNGIKGDTQKFGRDWLGFWEKDMVALIDLSKKQTITHLNVGTLESPSSWIYFPNEVVFEVSTDGIKYETIQTFSQSDIQQAKGNVDWKGKKVKAQFVKVTAKNKGKIQDGKPGAGNGSWLFVDEIIVE
ncbi:family 20 glycosylhydrolase [Flavobacterium sp. N1719]|uniref:glycoside hydrolase family 20 protein n=1 Tax=Flavobacterium sp. N1719 TaxID=2885633 RepID=UPI0022214E15|nr:family 20 glycosylhydrolase [Flavobacterium sp. N1719]